jgi:hypothetical protein
MARRVTFNENDAQRISRTVRAYERGNRDVSPVTFRQPSGDDSIVRGTFTAPWAKGSTATVTDATVSSVTYPAKNYFAAITSTGTRACAIAYVAGEWILIAAECE